MLQLEDATLLAMGYKLNSLFFVVAREGFLLALFGYLPAYFSGQILYSIIRQSTKLPIIMDADKTILIFILVLVMCMGSAGIVFSCFFLFWFTYVIVNSCFWSKCYSSRFCSTVCILVRIDPKKHNIPMLETT